MSKLAILLLKILATLVIVAMPTLGVWVGSSMAAYLNGPLWAAVLAGLTAVGAPLQLPQPMTGMLLAGAGVLAVVGGFVAAVAYHEASKRL